MTTALSTSWPGIARRRRAWTR